ncbi:adenosylcobinamide-phosphate synthase CbiB [Paenibacillus sp. CAU 1782]
MFIYSFQEMLLIAAAAILIDWIVGDPKWPTHPVIWIGRFISAMERFLGRERYQSSPFAGRLLGVVLALSTIGLSFGIMWSIVWAANWVHPWVGYTVSAWFVSTTIAVKGLKQAAMQVYRPLSEGNLAEARKYAGYIVGRDTRQLDEGETSRAAVETVAENTVDAFLSPVFFALLGGAPLAMAYRAANTLDSMVGYRNEKYRFFGWFSARTDDVLNLIPARLCGLLLAFSALLLPGMKSGKAVHSMLRFARSHPSPNSGIPESAVAGAIGIQLGGTNTYGGVTSNRAVMGWATRPIKPKDILSTVSLLYMVSALVWIGVIVLWLCLL